MSATTPKLTAYLSVRDAQSMIEFYHNAFGAKLVPPTLLSPDGSIIHAEMVIGESRLMLSEEHPEADGPAPLTIGGATCRMTLEVADAVEAYSKALDAGAEVVIPLQDQFYGHRAGRVRDPSGHLWIITEELEKLTEEQMQARIDAMMAEETEE